MQLEEFLEPCHPDIRSLFLTVRNLVLSSVPICEEVLHPGWKNLSFCQPGQRTPLVYIAPFRDSVNLGFYRGTELPDPDHLLRGTGKKLRHIKYKIPDQYPEESVTALITAAFKT